MKMRNVLAMLITVALLIGCLSFSVMAATDAVIDFSDLIEAGVQKPAVPESGDIVIPIIPIDPSTPVEPPVEDDVEYSDVNADGKTDTDDAVYLLLNVMFGESYYPLVAGAKVDFDGSGAVNTDDAVYLLLHVMFGEQYYPLHTTA